MQNTLEVGAPTRSDTGMPSILLVDDQPARLLTYESILTGLPVRCVRAASGHEALQRLLTQEFAVIILDVNMPVMDGFEVARLVREHPRLERTPIIFVTGVHVSELDRLKGYEVGAIDYISVPVVPEILRSKVAILVELYQRRSELQTLNQALAEARSRLDRDHATALADSEAQLLAVFEHPTEATVVLQAHRDAMGNIDDWIYRHANTTAVKSLARSRDAIVGQRVSDLERERAPILIDKCTAVLSTGQFTRYDVRYGEIDYAITIYPAGRDTVILSGLDITERRRGEAALHESRQRLLIAQKAAQLATHDYDVRTGTITWDDLAYDIWGLERGTRVTYEMFASALHPDDVAETERAVAAALDPAGSGEYRARYRVRNLRDGQVRWVEATGLVTFENGQPARLVGTVQDITDRVRAATALAESEERFRRIFRDTGIGMVLIETDCTIRMANPAFCEIVGRSEDELLGTSCLAITHPADVDENFSLIGRLLESQERSAEYEEAICATGRIVPLGTHHVVRHTSPGDPERLLAAVEDITEHIEARQALDDAHRERKALLEAERTARSEAEVAVRAKDEFLATLSHELRTPLSNVVSWARVLQRKYAGEHADLAKGLSIIVDNAMTQSQLISDLLDMSRIVAGKITLEATAVDVVDLVSRAVDAQRPAAEAKGLTISVTRGLDVGFVLADEARLQQIVWNLLSNAIKFTPAHATAPISASIQRDGDCYVVSVTDPGEGIDPRFLPHLFGRFRQADGSRARRHGGLGLGLAIVKQLVQMHGGSVSAASPGLGQGATFTVSLPVHDADVRSAVPTPLEDTDSFEATPALAGRTILVVEDQPAILEHLKHSLEEYGAETVCVSSARDALAALRSQRFELLLSDLGLPEMDGYQLIRTVREELQLSAQALPAVAVSAFARDEDRARSILLGYQAHIVKPYLVAHIVKTVAGLLNRSE